MVRIWALVCLAGCATAPAPRATTSEPEPTPTTTASTTSNDELAASFEPPPPTAPVAPPPPVSTEKPDAALRTALGEGTAALKARAFDRARDAARIAVSEAAALDGLARLDAHQLATRIELFDKQAVAAWKRALAWRVACGPERIEKCRAAALAALKSAAKLPGAPRSATRDAKSLDDAERCAAKSDRSAKPLPCERAALTAAKAHGDAPLVQRLLFTQALRAPRGGQPALLERADKACESVGCTAQHRKIATKRIELASSPTEALGIALHDVKISAAPLAADQRTYARTALLDQTCVSFETSEGRGSCRTAEYRELGYWTFTDFSRQGGGEGLTSDQVRQVNDHFAPLLQQCLQEQARRLRPPDAREYEVRWVVHNDGRVGETHLRDEADAGPLVTCLRTQFTAWRYPRYDGELQNVEQRFTVTAAERSLR